MGHNIYSLDVVSECDARHKVWVLCEDFIEENEIHCSEGVYQCDHVIRNACDFIAEICDVVGYIELDD